MILCHINLNLEYAQLHNKTAGNNQVLLIVEFCVHVKVMYIKYFANYLLMYVINTLSAPYYNPNIFDPVNILYLV